MPIPRFVPRFALSGLLITTAVVAIALTLFATYDRFAILLMVAVLAAIAFVGLAWPRRMVTKCYSVTCGMISLSTVAYLCAVAPATWIVARLHTLDSSGRPEYVFAFQCVLDPAAECWVDSPAPIRAAFMSFLNLGMPPSASLDEYPSGFGYTTYSKSGGSANVILAIYDRGG